MNCIGQNEIERVNSETEIKQNIELNPSILCKKDAMITSFAWNNCWVELELELWKG